MWLLIRWGAAILLAITPLFNILQHSYFDSPTKSLSTQLTVKLTLENALTLWHEAKYQASIKVLNQIEKPKPEVSFYRGYFERYLQNTLNPKVLNHSDFADNCAQKIIFVTGDVYSLAQAEVFISRFANDKRLTALPICIEPTIWFDPVHIDCQQNQGADGRLACDLPKLAKSLKTQSFTHLVVFAEKGKANVHNGIMFLDQQDSYDVFVHELAHFAGFVDEYPLSPELAAQICAGIDAPNLVFGPADSKEVNTEYWQSIGLDVSAPLVKARTCDNHFNQAYKVEKKLTFMEYHDVAYIPRRYLDVWKKGLLERNNSPSAHINFAQFYEEKNNNQEGQFWRAKYQAYLKE